MTAPPCTDVDRCPCGEPLHYPTHALQRTTERLIHEMGPNLDIWVGGRGYSVPRAYIAQHRVLGGSLPELAEKYGWPELGS